MAPRRELTAKGALLANALWAHPNSPAVNLRRMMTGEDPIARQTVQAVAIEPALALNAGDANGLGAAIDGAFETVVENITHMNSTPDMAAFMSLNMFYANFVDSIETTFAYQRTAADVAVAQAAQENGEDEVVEVAAVDAADAGTPPPVLQLAVKQEPLDAPEWPSTRGRRDVIRRDERRRFLADDDEQEEEEEEGEVENEEQRSEHGSIVEEEEVQAGDEEQHDGEESEEQVDEVRDEGLLEDQQEEDVSEEGLVEEQEVPEWAGEEEIVVAAAAADDQMSIIQDGGEQNHHVPTPQGNRAASIRPKRLHDLNESDDGAMPPIKRQLFSGL